MTENETLWAERVEEFHRSGRSAPVFANGRGYTASALKYWEKKLKARPQRSLALARVVRAGTIAESNTEGTVELLVGSARIVVRRGFDPVLVRELVDALGGAR
jgi:hypothetical protein